MRVFKRHKTLDEVSSQCAAQGLSLDTRAHRLGSDFVVIEAGGAKVLYDPCFGRFFGYTPGHEHFSHDQDRQEPWFLALLDFFYTDRPKGNER